MDTIIAGGKVVTETGVVDAHVGISKGRIAALIDGRGPVPPGSRVIDASGLIVVPGAIDAHTHFTGAHPGDAAEVEAGTMDAAAGGITTVLEMPHSDPPATTLDSFLKKRSMMADRAVVDFGLWGGIGGDTLDELPRLHEAGAVAMKGFMVSGDPSGRAPDARGLPQVDDGVLLRAMQSVAAFDGLIGLHAENHDILHGRMAALKAAGRYDPLAHAQAAPEIAEIEAVSRAIVLARETGVRLHIVHLSSARAATLINAARADVRISVETCPQYLMLDEDDLVRIGANARCGPPLRARPIVDALWSVVLAEGIDSLASDHCPYLPAQKEAGSASIWNAAMGLTGIRTTSPLFFNAAVLERGLPLTSFASMTATAPAKLFGLYPRKGAIAVGADADLVLYDPASDWQIKGEAFRGPAKWTPFEGVICRGRIVRTLVRGTSVFDDGDIRVGPGSGHFVGRRGIAEA